MLLLFLPTDKSRENYRDVICTVMRQLLRKTGFCCYVPTQAGVASILAEKCLGCYILVLVTLTFLFQITSWNTQKMTQSLSSPLSRWLEYFKIFNVFMNMWLEHSEVLVYVLLIRTFIWNFFQIISDLLHFKGSHKHEFDSRWKSFNLVKKSMENRVRLLG